jgi:hypothetical protein
MPRKTVAGGARVGGKRLRRRRMHSNVRWGGWWCCTDRTTRSPSAQPLCPGTSSPRHASWTSGHSLAPAASPSATTWGGGGCARYHYHRYGPKVAHTIPLHVMKYYTSPHLRHSASPHHIKSRPLSGSPPSVCIGVSLPHTVYRMFLSILIAGLPGMVMAQHVVLWCACVCARAQSNMLL